MKIPRPWTRLPVLMIAASASWMILMTGVHPAEAAAPRKVRLSVHGTVLTAKEEVQPCDPSWESAESAEGNSSAERTADGGETPDEPPAEEPLARRKTVVIDTRLLPCPEQTHAERSGAWLKYRVQLRKLPATYKPEGRTPAVPAWPKSAVIVASGVTEPDGSGRYRLDDLRITPGRYVLEAVLYDAEAFSLASGSEPDWGFRVLDISASSEIEADIQLVDCRCGGPIEEAASRHFTVYYGTDRQRAYAPRYPLPAALAFDARSQGLLVDGAERDVPQACEAEGMCGTSGWSALRYYGTEQRPPTDPLEHGTCEVDVSPDERLSLLDRALLVATIGWDGISPEFATIGDLQPMKPGEFFPSLSAESAKRGRQGLVYIHGYNTSFADGCKATAQLSYDVGFQGVPLLFSWASAEAALAYTADEETIQVSASRLKAFLDDVRQKGGFDTVHVVAHSMGSRALLEALLRSAPPAPIVSSPAAYGQIVFVAPDVYRDVFVDRIEALGVFARRVTLYASGRDRVLGLSSLVHGRKRRAGQSGRSLVVLRSLDTVDASKVKTDFNGHSYHRDRNSVVADLFDLIREGKPPAERAALIPGRPGLLPYWIIRSGG